MDGWCQGILHQELLELYRAEVENRPSELPPAPEFSSYIRWLGKQDEERSKKYWTSVIGDMQQPALVPGRKKTPQQGGPCRLSFSLTQEESDALRRLGQVHGVSLNTVFQTCWAIVLAKLTGLSQVAFGMVVSGRPGEVESIERMVGLFINTVMLRVDLHDDDTFETILTRTSEQFVAGLDHHYLPTAEILACSPLGDSLMTHAVAFENFPDNEGAPEGDELTIQSEGDFQGHTNFEFLCLVDPADVVSVHLKYNSSFFDPSRIQLLADALRLVVGKVIADPALRIADLDLLPQTEQERLASYMNGETLDTGAKNVVQLLAEQAALHPQKIAVVAYDGSLTYQEFYTSAQKIAGGLIARGACVSVHLGQAGKTDQTVGVLLPRAALMLPSLFGILAAGAAYVPIDPEYPENRIAFMLQDAGCMAVLTVPEYMDRIPSSWQGLHLDVNELVKESSAVDPVQINATDLAYIIYTSGSTGQSKGVMVEHKALANFAVGFNHVLGLDTPMQVAMVANYVFDASGRAIYPTLLRGDTVHVIDSMTRVDGQRLARYLAENKIGILDGTPTLCRLVLQAPVEAREGVELRYLICGGEAMPPQFPKLAKDSGVGTPTIYNVYGPTETTIDSTWNRLKPEDCALLQDGQAIPIGKPLPNQKTYILDDSGKLLPVGAVGELCIAGAGLARGYCGRPELDAEKFVPDPFYPGESMYRTGDRAMWNEEGCIVFCGRVDDQLKIRGYRIEPGEIEKRLSEHASVQGCAVIACNLFEEESEDSLELVGYYCAQNDPGEEALRTWLAETLPPQMVPGYFVRLDTLPLTSTGKINRRALKAPKVEKQAAAEIDQPQGEMEKQIAAVWCEVLNRPVLGREENFFNAGGHSLRAAKVAAKLSQVLERQVSPTWVYLAPTIKGFAALLAKFNGQAASAVSEPYFELGDPQAPAVYCLPPFGGSGISWTDLARACRGVRFVCFNYTTHKDGFAAAVTESITLMHQDRADPVTLLGYSGGGSFAFDVAKSLENAGIAVNSVLMFDSWRRLDAVCADQNKIAAEVDQLLKEPEVAVYLTSPTQKTEVRKNAVYYAMELYQGIDEGKISAPIRLLAAEGAADDPYAGPQGQMRSRKQWQDCTSTDFVIEQGRGSHDIMLSGEFAGHNAVWLCEQLCRDGYDATVSDECEICC